MQATQTLLSRVPETTSEEFQQAVSAASEAYKTWSRSSVLTRQRFVLESVLSAASRHAVSDRCMQAPESSTKTCWRDREQHSSRTREDAARYVNGLLGQPCICLTTSDAHGDLARGLQVVETAANIPTALLGDTLEGVW